LRRQRTFDGQLIDPELLSDRRMRTTSLEDRPAMTQSPTQDHVELDPEVRRALGHGHTIDITTIGRRSGEPRRIEMVFHSFGGHLYISGTPNPGRTRAWLHNMRANPKFTFHLKQTTNADLPATAREITDEPERTEVMSKVARVWRRDPTEMVAHSPLVEVTIPGFEAPAAD
jgi:deazaflavin-dependent oxidoreductase (nitroreductase family)